MTNTEKFCLLTKKFSLWNSPSRTKMIFVRSSKKASKLIPKVQRSHHPASVMVSLGISFDRVTIIHFCGNHTLFNNKHWVFQQDSAPERKAKTTQACLQQNAPSFVTTEDSASPDLNPLDQKLWYLLESMDCSKKHSNIGSLKRVLTKAVNNFSSDKVRATIT